MLVTDDWIMVFNPRTGSRSLADGFKQLGMIGDIWHHHDYPVVADGRPVYGFIRNPLDWCWSWYWPSYPEPFEEWMKKDLPTVPFADGRLNAYYKEIDHYFIYELGIAQVFQYFGLELPQIHRIGGRPKPCQPYMTHSIMEKFQDDWQQWNHICESKSFVQGDVGSVFSNWRDYTSGERFPRGGNDADV